MTAHERWQDRAAVLLDRTAFYPEAGGQMADRGKLGGLGVTDVQVDDAGRVFHVLEGPLPAIGAEIEGEIAKERRRVHMALHTGQHMLSRALADLAGAATVSSRLGETACTIDVDQEAVEERRIAAAEDLVNAIIDDDVPVRAFFPTPGELASLPLRRAPTVTENIRVIAIGDFDVSPCGGTHCVRSAQVGLVHVTGVERYKGKIRVSFAAGARARRDLGAHATTLRALGRELSCDPLLAPQGVAKLREELSGSRDALGKTRGRLAEAIAVGLGKDGLLVVALIEDGADGAAPVDRDAAHGGAGGGRGAGGAHARGGDGAGGEERDEHGRLRRLAEAPRHRGGRARRRAQGARGGQAARGGGLRGRRARGDRGLIGAARRAGGDDGAPARGRRSAQ